MTQISQSGTITERWYLGKPKSFSQDILGCCNSLEVSRTAFQFIDSVQCTSAENQLAGVSVVFLMYCRHVGLDPIKALTVADNVIRHNTTIKQEHTLAVQSYLDNEIEKPSNNLRD